MARSVVVWVLRGLWFLLPLTVGQAASDAISSAPNAVPQVATVGLWSAWAVGLVASMVLVPVSLTAIRLLAPGVFAVAIWAAIDNDMTVIDLVAVIHADGILALVLAPLIGDRFVDGASYGDERRMLLRPPAVLKFAVAPIAWCMGAAGLVAGPLLLADRRWALGVVLAAVGILAAAVVSRALHQLSRRWIVFVPTGMVLHDLNVLTEPVLFRRTAIERLGPAIDGSPARDLSLGAAGLLLECELADAAPLGLRDIGSVKGGAKSADVRRFLFCPSRPGALLDEAENRRIAVD